MFASFKMDLPEFVDSSFNELYEKGKESFSSQKQCIQNSLDKYLAPDGSIKARELEGDWFPSIKADVFLSHSHKDEKHVIAFAGYLSTLGITSFIDSCVWGYANDLLKQIDKKYCVQSTGPTGNITYDYDKRNYSTAQVHMILNGALLKMMDRTETLIFLDTPNSLKTEDVSLGTTNSCWIYSELLMSGCLKKKAPIRKSTQFRLDESFEHSALSAEYDVDIKHLIKLSLSDIMTAKNQSKAIGPSILDWLYFNKGLHASGE